MSDRPSILFIDDSEVLLARVESRLASEGYDVRTTTQTIGNARYLRTSDLVIIDYHMPGIDGPDVLRSLRAAAGDRKTCLFYLYTSDVQAASDYVAHGFDGAFTQKGDLEALAMQVRSALRIIRTRALREKALGSKGGVGSK